MDTSTSPDNSFVSTMVDSKLNFHNIFFTVDLDQSQMDDVTISKEKSFLVSDESLSAYSDDMSDHVAVSEKESLLVRDNSLSSHSDDISIVSGPVMNAVLDNNPTVLHELLKDGKFDPDQCDEGGRTPLFIAAEKGYDECVRLLLLSGAVPNFDSQPKININARDEEGVSILQAAVLSGHVDICSLLLLHGADPDSPDMDGDTPRSCAKSYENSSEMQRLFRRHLKGDKIRSNYLFHEATLSSIIEYDDSSCTISYRSSSFSI